jgi:hypothetical protein
MRLKLWQRQTLKIARSSPKKSLPLLPLSTRRNEVNSKRTSGTSIAHHAMPISSSAGHVDGRRGYSDPMRSAASFPCL